MSFRTSLLIDLPNIYAELADATATYNTVDFDVFFDDDYEIDNMSSKVIKAMTSDVSAIAEGEQMVIDSIAYAVLNFKKTNDGLETIIALNEVV